MQPNNKLKVEKPLREKSRRKLRAGSAKDNSESNLKPEDPNEKCQTVSFDT
jgi:hypothetical protein